jgi:AraC-like DNA-binding protein
MSVVYRQTRPSAALRPFVERLWYLEGPASAIAGEPIPPDGRPEIIVHGGDPYAQRGADGRLHVQARVLLAGQLTHAMDIVPRGFARIAGAQLRPHGAYDLLRVAQHTFTDRIVDLRSIDRALAQTLADNVAMRHDATEMMAALEQTLARFGIDRRAASAARAQRAHAGGRAAEAVTIALTLRGMIGVAGIARAVRVGTRQLERLFRERVGISPKLFLRIVRFQEVLRATKTGRRNPGWAAVAAEHGYYDQAHFINDFKAFVGRTPGEWRISYDSLAAIFSAVRRESVDSPQSTVHS